MEAVLTTQKWAPRLYSQKYVDTWRCSNVRPSPACCYKVWRAQLTFVCCRVAISFSLERRGNLFQHAQSELHEYMCVCVWRLKWNDSDVCESPDLNTFGMFWSWSFLDIPRSVPDLNTNLDSREGKKKKKKKTPSGNPSLKTGGCYNNRERTKSKMGTFGYIVYRLGLGWGLGLRATYCTPALDFRTQCSWLHGVGRALCVFRLWTGS